MPLDIVQGSNEWKQQRLGHVTASRVADVVAKTKSGWSASRANYAAQLIAERLTGVPQDSYSNAAMQWGTEHEPVARSAYEFFSGHEVQQVSFIQHPTIKFAGCSPDGLVGGDGLVEIKCPNTSTHIETLLSSEIDKKYISQMLWQMACTGRKWCDFVSFDPRMPEELQLKIIRLNKDDAAIKTLEYEVSDFLDDVSKTIDLLKKLEISNAA